MNTILFNGATYVSMNGGIILSDNTIKGTGRWQLGVRCYSGHNCMAILFEDAANLPSMYNAEGYMQYVSTGIYVQSYVSGSHGAYSAICGIALPGQDSNWNTMDFNFDANVVTCYRNGVNVGTADISRLNGANIRCIMQNYYSDPHGQAWFQDGSPTNPISYPIPLVPTLSDHLNLLDPSAMKDKDEHLWAYL